MPHPLQRRAFLSDVGLGFAGVALQSLLQREARGLTLPEFPDGKPHFQPRAKNVIWLFMRGGVSHM